MDKITKRMNSYQNEIVKCKCGHSVFLPKLNPVKVCSHCGNILYKNKKYEFIYKLMTNKPALRED